MPEAPGAKQSAHEKRAQEALERRKVPKDGETPIHLPDANAEKNAHERRAELAQGRRKNPSPDGPPIHLPDANAQQPQDQQAENSPENKSEAKRFFSLMPGEVAKMPDGGDF